MRREGKRRKKIGRPTANQLKARSFYFIIHSNVERECLFFSSSSSSFLFFVFSLLRARIADTVVLEINWSCVVDSRRNAATRDVYTSLHFLQHVTQQRWRIDNIVSESDGRVSVPVYAVDSSGTHRESFIFGLVVDRRSRGSQLRARNGTRSTGERAARYIRVVRRWTMILGRM